MKTQNEYLKKASKVIRALNHPMRQEIINLIGLNEKMCVTEIYTKLKIEQSVASSQLKILRLEKILITERQGKNIIYKVNNERIVEILSLCEQLVK